MKKILILIFMIFFVNIFLIAKIDLNKAIAAAIKKNYDYQNLQIDLEISNLNISKAKGNLLFDINLSSDYLYRSETMKINFSELMGSGSPIKDEIEFGSHHYFDTALSIIQPLYTGGKIRNSITLSQIKKESKVSEIQFKENQVAGMVKKSYFQYIILNQNKKILRNSLKNLNVHIQKLQEWLKNKMVRKIDLLEAKVKIEEIKMQMMDLDERIEQESTNFRRLCGLNLLNIKLGYQESQINYAEAVIYFKRNHPYFKWVVQKTKLLEIQQDLVKGKYLPQVFGFVKTNYGKPGINIFEDQWSFYYQMGLSFKLNVFSWNQRSKELNQLDYQVQKLKNIKEQFESDLLRSLDLLFIKRDKLNKKIIMVQNIIKDAEEEFLLKEQLYMEKQINHSEYMDSFFKNNQYQIIRQRLLIQVELIKVNINNLIFRRL